MSSTAAQTATGYQRTFGGRADQLSQVRRDTAPLEAAVDTMIEHLSGLGMR